MISSVFMAGLFVGILGILMVLFLAKSMTGLLDDNHPVMQKLKNAKWFQNPWLAGSFLFALNAVLFFSTGLALYLLLLLSIPHLILMVIILAVIASIFSWVFINRAWQGTKGNRLKMGLIGSSFYALLTLAFLIRLVTLETSDLVDDACMGGIVGLILGILVTLVAFITCLRFTGFSAKYKAS